VEEMTGVGPIGAEGVGRPVPVSRPDYSDPDPDIDNAMKKIIDEYKRAKDIEGDEGKVEINYSRKEGKDKKHIYNITARYKNRSTALDRKVLDKVLENSPTLKKYNLKAWVRDESLVTPNAEIVVERKK
jgi:hypothetical protein